jgi:tellurite resistance protein
MAKRRDSVNDQWTRLMAAARTRWDRLSEDDVQSVRGNTERLISVLQTRYGFARAQAIKELTAWRQALTTNTAA